MHAGLFIVALIALLRTTSVQSSEILVFAAASLSDALQSIASDYEKESGHKVIFNFAASSILARQIQEGARADLFFSADEEKMDQLQKRSFIREGSRRSLLSNRLVVVVPKDTSFVPSKAQDLTRAKRIALAEPNTVPAGIYARRYLEKERLWANLKNNIIPTENVRGALSAVASGNADWAIVYKTDASMSLKVKIAYEIPESADLKISYPAAVLKEGKQPGAALHFLAYLQSPKAADVFRHYGFIVPKS
jgi:molybdate transport system substrate-binding protein